MPFYQNIFIFVLPQTVTCLLQTWPRIDSFFDSVGREKAPLRSHAMNSLAENLASQKIACA